MKRIHYFDLLRCTCFCFIIFYHLLFQLYLSGICPVERLNPLFSNSNMHLATLGVAVFFMLSGASLSYTAKENFSLAKYYKKRFLRILIPFIYFTLFISCFSFSRAIPSTIFFLKEFLRGELFLLFLNGFLGQHARDQHLFPYHRRMVSGMSYSVVSDLSIASIFYDKM